MLRILEISWLSVFIFGIAFAAFKALTESFSSAVYVLFVSFIALVLYLIRRKQRILMDRQNNQKS